MQKTGLLELIANHLINNLVDYVLGIETGLDSNGRKNRGGHQMEDLVEGYIKKSGAEYYKEMYLTDIERKWNVDLSAISAEGTSTKRWDFVVKTQSTIFVIETNFYGGGGSKLNETARSYKMIAEEARAVDGVEFIAPAGTLKKHLIRCSIFIISMIWKMESFGGCSFRSLMA